MAATLELCSMLAEILNDQEIPVLVIDKLRELKVVEVADFATLILTRRLERIAAGLAAHAHDLGDFFQLFKLEEVSPEVAMCVKMCARRIWSECKSALEPHKPVGSGGN